tara:strand:+ start:833 stop:1309 length:477 start_codon:yes stop_codon:yes gene_type:complete
MKTKDITKIKRSQWQELGGSIARRIVEDADKGISQDGSGTSRDFKEYSFAYAKKKAAGKAGPKGVSTSKQVSPPNLRLTSEMLNSIKAQKATSNSVEINYRSGLKVLGHSKRRGNKPKRNIYGLNDKNQKHVKDFIENVIDDRIIKFNKKKIVFKIDL